MDFPGSSKRRNNYKNRSKKETTAEFSYGGAKPKTNPSTFVKQTYPKSTEMKFSSDINRSIQAYENVLNIFQRRYRNWNIERQSTISQLKTLLEELHETHLAFNSNNLFFKELDVDLRTAKRHDGSARDFFASLGSLLSGAMESINSVAQACDIDKNMKTFGEIMEHDAEITKPMHEARSSCFEKYRNVEEIVRKYHSDTFGATCDKLCKITKIENKCMELMETYNGNSEIMQVFEKLNCFFEQISKAEVFDEVQRSVKEYVDSNPAVLEACASTGKTLYGVYETCSYNSKNVVSKSVTMATNRALISRQQSEICRLNGMVKNEESPQVKLESKIQDAIQDLEKEALEMKSLYESCSISKIKNDLYSDFY